MTRKYAKTGRQNRTRIADGGQIRRAYSSNQRGTDIYSTIRRMATATEMPRDRKELTIARKLLTNAEPVHTAIAGFHKNHLAIIVLSHKPARKREVKFPFSATGYINPEKFAVMVAKDVIKVYPDMIWYLVLPNSAQQISKEDVKGITEEWYRSGKRLVTTI